MPHRFQKHYTREEARALLPEIRGWLGRLSELHKSIDRQETKLQGMIAPQTDQGGQLVNDWVRNLAQFRTLLVEFYRRDIQVKDLDRGLIDFPAIIGGREVFLCWEQDEEDIEFWHDLDSGYAGRERL
jgi:hypothetical protein